MKQCPQCKSECELSEKSCRSCGASTLSEHTHLLHNSPPSKEDLAESYQNWIDRGIEWQKCGNLEEASNALREAVKRSRLLPDPVEKEIAARKMLGEVLERLGKIPEAADQYRIISQESNTAGLREHWLKKSQDLLASSHLPFDELFKKEDFRPFVDEELRYVPLYCSGCKRLFTESETFSVRRKLDAAVKCWCGVEDKPIAKDDAKHSVALERGKAMSSGQRAKAIYIAGSELASGKKQATACALALTLGWCGGHKFYLGEIVAGWIYLLWFWTLVPLLLSLYEAMLLSQMSQTTFNMTYNLDVILLKILSPEEKNDGTDKSDVFSLELGETKEVG